jgi:hypothetical protein
MTCQAAGSLSCLASKGTVKLDPCKARSPTPKSPTDKALTLEGTALSHVEPASMSCIDYDHTMAFVAFAAQNVDLAQVLPVAVLRAARLPASCALPSGASSSMNFCVSPTAGTSRSARAC